MVSNSAPKEKNKKDQCLHQQDIKLYFPCFHVKVFFSKIHAAVLFMVLCTFLFGAA
jgi:hypothetical protein